MGFSLSGGFSLFEGFRLFAFQQQFIGTETCYLQNIKTVMVNSQEKVFSLKSNGSLPVIWEQSW
jgi:hypothetical protein